MKRLLFSVCLLLILAPAAVFADSSLQLNPLKYEDNLGDATVRQGFVEVSNPSDTSVNITTSVRGFRQVGLDGNLEFYDDPVLTAGIIPNLGAFTLGPREAIRVTFSVNPSKLPHGGVYAAIFFRTLPEASASNVSYLLESANVGTLLLLNNGSAGSPVGSLKTVSMSFWQFSSKLKGSLIYHNADRNLGGFAVTPKLSAKIQPFGKIHPLTSSLVLPQASRKIDFAIPGAYIGLIPVHIAADVHSGKTVWIFACTGFYAYFLLILSLAFLVLLGVWSVRNFIRNR